MDAHRWSNVSRSRSSYGARRVRLDGRPLEAYLEIAARCNLRCRMCPINFDSRYVPRNGRPALFEPALFDRMRPLFPTLLRAHLYGLGEPVLNPHLVDYVRDLSAAGVEVWFTTNATLIDDELAEAFAEAGADRISISIDGATAGTYESIRRGARFADLRRGLEALGGARRRHGRPRLTVNFVAMKQNVRELPEMVDLCAEIGIEELNVEPLFFWGEECSALGEQYRDEVLGSSGDRAVIAETARRAAKSGLHFSTRFESSQGVMDYKARVDSDPTDGDWICSEPWATIYVTVAGEVRTCCLNDETFGNLFDETFDEIWNGEAFRKFRGQHLSGTEAPKGCSACTSNGRKRHSPYFESVEPVSYRPLRKRDSHRRPAGGFELDVPADSAVVTDPLVVSGRLPAGEDGARRLPDVLIDRMWVSSVGDAIRDGDRFLLVLSVPYLSEGTHLVSLCSGSDEDPGASVHCQRTIQFWRPSMLRPDSLAATDRGGAILTLDRPAAAAGIRVDGHEWPSFAWFCHRRPVDLPIPGVAELGRARQLARWLRGRPSSRRVWLAGAVLDLTELASGSHALEILPEQGAAWPFQLERLPG